MPQSTLCRAVCKEELQELLSHSTVKRRAVPILVLANKMDLPSSKQREELSIALDLGHLASLHCWKIIHCCGLTGEGINAGWEWLTAQMAKVKGI
jgi:signal recognition particle receptor subunit beta